MTYDLKDQKFIIAGYGEPLGEAICRILLSHGAVPLLVARNKEALENASLRLEGSDYYPCDLSDDSSLRDLYDHVKKKFGSIRGIVVTVGGFFYDDVQTPGDTQTLVNSNLLVPMKVISSLLGILEKSGSVVFTSSITTLRFGEKNPLSYTVTKYALNGLTYTLATELIAKNIRVNAIAISSISEIYSPNREWKKTRKLGDHSTPAEDIANVVYFLLSDLSEMVDGAIIPVDGGSRFRS
ncbi:MAG: SDR family oxidoreductase [Candidatus Thermoplasmatota archaeon]|jgi:3-oxoacyl-[acyl-carrier protein] reductase|nr:SDR family oxidoreductase [Candidatus Thermoplasmatota archaeon]